MIPLRVSALKLSGAWPQNIVIHHTGEWLPDHPKYKFDTNKIQSLSYMDYSFKSLKKRETGYHFLIDKVGVDFAVIVSQPLLTNCVYSDLSEQYENSIHIGLIGNYDKDLPEKRLYKILSYRLLFPLMRMFYIEDNEILLHKEITTNKQITCPGEFFDKTTLFSQLRTLRKKRSVRRG